MKSLLESLWLTAVTGTLFCGCARTSPEAGVDPKAFAAAPPEIKQAWDEALAASAQNDPGSAISTLRLLSRQNISREQRTAVRNALVVYEAKLRETAKQGDPAARKAMQDLGVSSAAPGR